MKHKTFTSFEAALKKRLKVLKADSAHVVVGVVKNKKQARSTGKGENAKPEKATNAQIATVHEYGSKTVPARPFLRPTVDKERGAMMVHIEKAFKRSIKEGTSDIFLKTLKLVGQSLKDSVFKAITSGPSIPPPLSPKTIARKGSSRALVDTGQMARSITYEVRKK